MSPFLSIVFSADLQVYDAEWVPSVRQQQSELQSGRQAGYSRGDINPKIAKFPKRIITLPSKHRISSNDIGKTKAGKSLRTSLTREPPFPRDDTCPPSRSMVTSEIHISLSSHDGSKLPSAIHSLHPPYSCGGNSPHPYSPQHIRVSWWQLRRGPHVLGTAALCSTTPPSAKSRLGHG